MIYDVQEHGYQPDKPVGMFKFIAGIQAIEEMHRDEIRGPGPKTQAAGENR